MPAKLSFVKSDSDLLKYVSTIKKEHHPRLRDSRLLVLWRTDADFGHKAIAQVVPPLFRFMTQTDAILLVHKGSWDNILNEQQKAYWIDTALTMLFASDKVADDGRPKLITAQPEKIGFQSVIQRHGSVTRELQSLEQVFEETKQVDIFELLREAIPEQFGYAGYNANDAVAEKEFGGTFGFNTLTEMELFIKAARLVMRERKANALLLQLHLNVNYQTASMLMDSLVEAKFITAFDVDAGGHKVLVTEDMIAFYVNTPSETDEEEESDNEPGVEPHMMDQAAGADNVVHLHRQ